MSIARRQEFLASVILIGWMAMMCIGLAFISCPDILMWIGLTQSCPSQGFVIAGHFMLILGGIAAFSFFLSLMLG